MRSLLVVLLFAVLLGASFVRADQEHYNDCVERMFAENITEGPCTRVIAAISEFIYFKVVQLPHRNETLVVDRYDFSAIHKRWVNWTYEGPTYQDAFGDILSSLYLSYRICLKNETLVDEIEGWYLNGNLYAGKSRCVEIIPIIPLYDGRKYCEWISKYTKTVYEDNVRRFVMELALVWKGYKIGEVTDTYRVNIKVIGGGKVSPRQGSYLYKKDSVLLLKAEDNLSDGTIFYMWNINGELRREMVYNLKVKSSINITAIFKNIREIAKGSDVDLDMNKDLVASIVHKGWNGSIILGGPAVNNYSWEYGFLRERGYNGLIINGEKYRVKYGEYDYALVKLDGGTLRVAGVTRYGTRAGLMWALLHMGELKEGKTYIVIWRDINGNGLVEEGELSRFY